MTLSLVAAPSQAISRATHPSIRSHRAGHVHYSTCTVNTEQPLIALSFFLASFKLDDYTHNRLILLDIPCTSTRLIIAFLSYISDRDKIDKEPRYATSFDPLKLIRN